MSVMLGGSLRLAVAMSPALGALARGGRSSAISLSHRFALSEGFSGLTSCRFGWVLALSGKRSAGGPAVYWTRFVPCRTMISFSWAGVRGGSCRWSIAWQLGQTGTKSSAGFMT